MDLDNYINEDGDTLIDLLKMKMVYVDDIDPKNEINIRSNSVLDSLDDREEIVKEYYGLSGTQELTEDIETFQPNKRKLDKSKKRRELKRKLCILNIYNIFLKVLYYVKKNLKGYFLLSWLTALSVIFCKFYSVTGLSKLWVHQSVLSWQVH